MLYQLSYARAREFNQKYKKLATIVKAILELIGFIEFLGLLG